MPQYYNDIFFPEKLGIDDLGVRQKSATGTQKSLWLMSMSPYAMTCLAPQSIPIAAWVWIREGVAVENPKSAPVPTCSYNKSFLASWATTPGVTCSPTLFSYSLGEAPCCYPCCIDLLVAEPAADKLI